MAIYMKTLYYIRLYGMQYVHAYFYCENIVKFYSFCVA